MDCVLTLLGICLGFFLGLASLGRYLGFAFHFSEFWFGLAFCLALFLASLDFWFAFCVLARHLVFWFYLAFGLFLASFDMAFCSASILA